jgi:hypothetical protein
MFILEQDFVHKAEALLYDAELTKHIIHNAKRRVEEQHNFLREKAAYLKVKIIPYAKHCYSKRFRL